MGAEEAAFCGCSGKVQYERGNFLPQTAGIQTASEQVKSKLITKLRLSKGVLFDSRNSINYNIIFLNQMQHIFHDFRCFPMRFDKIWISFYAFLTK